MRVFVACGLPLTAGVRCLRRGGKVKKNAQGKRPFLACEGTFGVSPASAWPLPYNHPWGREAESPGAVPGKPKQEARQSGPSPGGVIL
jgi:hypothetical protein